MTCPQPVTKTEKGSVTMMKWWASISIGVLVVLGEDSTATACARRAVARAGPGVPQCEDEIDFISTTLEKH